MITASIMQPTYLPWVGYFKLIKSSDIFIFLDCVQFDKRSWQQRNYIRDKNNKILLTVPVHSKGKQNQKIKDVLIDNTVKWQNKHLNSMLHSYSKSKYFEQHFIDIKNIYNEKIDNLSNLNIKIIKMLCKKLKIKTKFINSSIYNLNLKKDELLYKLCKKVSADIFLSPPGSKNYLSETDYFNRDVKLEYYKYNKYIYDQNNKSFIESLSIIDFIFNNDLNNFNNL